MKRGGLGLRGRVTLVTITVAVLAVLVTGGVSLQLVHQSSIDEARAQLAYAMTYFNSDVLSYSLSFAALAILWRPRQTASLAAVPVCLFVMCNTNLYYFQIK